MAYQKDYPTKTHDGTKLIPLSVEKEVLEIREAIEKKEAHAGRNYEIAYQAYSEIKRATGKVPKDKNQSCSSCIHEINLLLNNWLKMYDSRLFANVKVDAPKAKPLVPKAETKSAEPSYKDLLTKFTAVATTEEKRTINNGNTPKKAQLIEYFTPKQDEEE